MKSWTSRRVATCAALFFAAVIGGCGGGGLEGRVGVGTITVSCIDIGDGTGTCTPLSPCIPDPFPSTPAEFIVTGLNFETVTGTTATVRFTALGGALPFLGGTSGTVDVVANVLSDTEICGTTPTVLVCGVGSIDAVVTVILESGVQDDSTLGPSFVITFNAPVITLVTPACVGSLSPTTVTLTGTSFGPVGPVLVRLESADGQAIFNDGSTTSTDIQADVTVADTTITFTSPRVANNVTPAVDPLQSVSDAIEIADIQVILGNESCSAAGPAGPDLSFARPEGDEARNRNFVAGTFGGLDPVGGLRVPQTIPTTIRVLGTDDPCSDPFAPIGGPVQIILSTPTGGPVNAFQLDSRDVGTADFDVVTGVIQSGTEIRFSTPRVRAFVPFSPVIRIVFENSIIAPVTPTVFTWDAPPVIGLGAAAASGIQPAIDNLNVGGGANNSIFGAEPSATFFIGAHSSRMQITGWNFQPPVDGASPAPDIGPSRVTLYDALSGTTGPDPLDPESTGAPARRLGTGNPVVSTTPNSAPAIGTGLEVGLGVEAPLTGPGNPAIPDYVVTATTITGSTRLDGLLADLDTDLDGLVQVRVRVVNPDGQVSETNSWDPGGTFVLDLDWSLTHAAPVNRTVDVTSTNNNVSTALDPTSVTDLVGGLPGAANDFAFPQAPEGALAAVNFGANLCVVAGNDTSAAFTFAATTIRLSFSRDGGLTWANNVIGGAGGAGVTVADTQAVAATRSFAQVAYDAFGNLFVAYLVNDPVAGTDRVIIGRSTTQGASWAFVTVADSLAHFGLGAGSFDRTSLSTGFSTDPGFGDGQGTYVSFVDVASFPNRVFVAGIHSTAFGFTPGVTPAPVQVDNVGANPIKQHARSAVGPGGELYVAWLEFDPLLFPFTSALMIDSDQDGLFGVTFAFDTLVDPDLVVDGSIPFPSSPRPVSVDFGPLLPTPTLTIARAGTHAGRLLVAYEEFNGSGPFGVQALQLLTRYSDDFGFSWSTPQMVAAPDPSTTAADQFLPALASDDVNGRFYVTWYDTSASAPAHDLTERWSAASEDGASWGAPRALSNGTSSAPGADAEFTDYGVHSGLAVFGGFVFAGWADNSELGGRMDAVIKLYQQSTEQAP